MKLHEYQAKEILKKSGVLVPNGLLICATDQAAKVGNALKGPPWVIKAQILAGGRGKCGGVRIVHDPHEVIATAEDLLGKALKTKQTGPRGVIVNQLLIEECVEIQQELYLSMVIDRARSTPAMIFSEAGGMEIEAIASQSPERIFKEYVNTATGWMPHQARNLIYGLNPLPQPRAIEGLVTVMASVFRIFMACDCSLLEINPLVITGQGEVIALDAKIAIDDNALFRQKELHQMEDQGGKDPLEGMAANYSLNYIRLEGNVGAMVNGAGLAMATMDVIKLAGAEPANFLDVGGGANEQMITKGLEIILTDKRVKAVLINIFGGILRCDVLARGVVAAAEHCQIHVPVIVRLEGTNVETGRRILEDSPLQFLVANNLAEAAEMVTRQVS